MILTKFHVCLGALTILLVNAAPSDKSSTEPTITTTENSVTKNPEELSLDLNKEVVENGSQNQRQKRWNSFYDFDLPPFSPEIYRPYRKRDEFTSTAVHGAIEDPFLQIHRRLQEIASYARPTPPPPLPQFSSQFPFLFPVVFIPQVQCGCGTQNNNQPQVTSTETSPVVVPEDRFPEMDDERQNWGVATNGTVNRDEDDIEAGSRPISFTPISPERPLLRPPPPVDHGSSQANSGQNPPPAPPPGNQQGSPQRPQARPPPRNPRPPPQNQPGPPRATSTTTVTPPSDPTNSITPPPETPNPCDAAILSCCHQSLVTYDCFVAQGCPDPTSYGNPCDIGVILSVIYKYQSFYGQRTS